MVKKWKLGVNIVDSRILTRNTIDLKYGFLFSKCGTNQFKLSAVLLNCFEGLVKSRNDDSIEFSSSMIF